MTWLVESLSKKVSRLITGRNVVHSMTTTSHLFTNKVIMKFNTLHLFLLKKTIVIVFQGVVIWIFFFLGMYLYILWIPIYPRIIIQVEIVPKLFIKKNVTSLSLDPSPLFFFFQLLQTLVVPFGLLLTPSWVVLVVSIEGRNKWQHYYQH